MKERIEELRALAQEARDEINGYFAQWHPTTEPQVVHTKMREALYTCTAALIEALQESAKASLPRCGYNDCWFEKGHTGNCSHD